MTLANIQSRNDFVALDALEDQRYRAAVAKYSASLMSDAKWLKFFRTVIQSGVAIERAAWQLIGAPRPIWESFPEEHNLMRTRFADGRFQPWEYRWIESVFVPTTFNPTPGVGYERKQDVGLLVDALEAAGKFPIEVSAAGLVLRAYQ